MWKRALQLMWAPDLPAYRVEIGKSQARSLIEAESGFEPWLEAQPKGERLGWRELPAYRALTEAKETGRRPGTTPAARSPCIWRSPAGR